MSLSNYLKPSDIGVLSYMSLSEVDCKEPRKIRQLSGTTYNLPMAKSDGNTFNKVQEWVYPPPNSILNVYVNIVCK